LHTLDSCTAPKDVNLFDITALSNLLEKSIIVSKCDLREWERRGTKKMRWKRERERGKIYFARFTTLFLVTFEDKSLPRKSKFVSMWWGQRKGGRGKGRKGRKEDEDKEKIKIWNKRYISRDSRLLQLCLNRVTFVGPGTKARRGNPKILAWKGH
jgi:hypothetical protein